MKPPPASARSFKAPPLHAIALVERLERGGGRTELGAVVNLLTGDRGAPALWHHRNSGGRAEPGRCGQPPDWRQGCAGLAHQHHRVELA